MTASALAAGVLSARIPVRDGGHPSLLAGLAQMQRSLAASVTLVRQAVAVFRVPATADHA